MKLPKQVIILGVPYKIKYQDTMPISNNMECWGIIDYQSQKITVYKNGRNKQHIMKTILHEILHAVIVELKLWNEIKGGWSGQPEERIVTGISTAIIGLEWKY